MILFVGDKPSSRIKSGSEAFKGAMCEKRLMEWIRVMGIEWGEYSIINCTDDSFVLSS